MLGLYCSMCPLKVDAPSHFVLVFMVTGTESEGKYKIVELSSEQEVRENKTPMATPVLVTNVYTGDSHYFLEVSSYFLLYL